MNPWIWIAAGVALEHAVPSASWWEAMVTPLVGFLCLGLTFPVIARAFHE